MQVDNLFKIFLLDLVSANLAKNAAACVSLPLKLWLVCNQILNERVLDEAGIELFI